MMTALFEYRSSLACNKVVQNHCQYIVWMKNSVDLDQLDQHCFPKSNTHNVLIRSYMVRDFVCVLRGSQGPNSAPFTMEFC